MKSGGAGLLGLPSHVRGQNLRVGGRTQNLRVGGRSYHFLKLLDYGGLWGVEH